MAMNHDQHKPSRVTITAPEPDQDPAHDGPLRGFPYWIITFDGTRLRKQRRARGLSQERLAYRSGISLATIQRVEKLPAADCHVRTLRRLASALSPDPDALISELTENTGGQADRAPLTPAPRPRVDRWWQEAKAFQAHRTEHGRYTPAKARELLAKTSDFPHTKGAMLMLLTEYQHALYDIATEYATSTKPAPA
jgi:transcriptional regulator with XRE-family HTH domain